MSSRFPTLAASLIMLATMLAACSDPLDDEPKGQTIPTHAELATGYAAGSGPLASGGGSPAPARAGSDAGASSSGNEGGAANDGGMPAGLVGQTQGGGGGGATGFLPPAGLQAAPDGQADGAGQSGAGQGGGGTSGGSGAAGG